MLLPSQTKTNRSLGNSQSRLSAMPSSPAYGNTTNVNGAQTAVGGQPVMRMTGPGDPVPMLKGQDYDYRKDLQGRFGIPGPELSGYSQSSAPAYPGGDAPGISRFYRNTAIQGYLNNQMVPYSPLQSNAQSGSMMMDDRYQAAQMRGLAGEIDAIRERSQIANPMVPNSPAMTGFVDPQAESDRRMAPALARDAAKQQNTPANGNTAFANDPNRLTPDQKAGLARESALRAAGGGPAADPTGLGARFGGAMGQQASSDYDAIQNGQAVRLADGSVARFTGTPESAKIAQNKGKIERESLRDRKNLNVPQEELDRRKRADAHKKERADRHQAFRDQNDGMNYRQYDRLQRTQQSIQRKVADGRLDQATADRMLEQETNKAMRRAEGRRSALVNADQSRPLPLAQAAEPQRVRQQPDAAAAVEQMATQSPIIKNLGITVESKPQDVMNSIASMNPQQMTSDQKFEAARHLHEYMLSQIESGNPAYALEDGISSDSKDPRLGFLGLQSLPPDNKDAMVRWFEDLHRQAKALGTPSTASPFGNAMPIRTGA